MEQYIPKSALVAEIERLIGNYSKCPTRNDYEEGLKDGRLIGYKDALHKIDTLEVKEVENPNNAFIEKVNKFFEDYFTEENCKFGISEWTEVKSGFESLDSLKRAFKNYMEG